MRISCADSPRATARSQPAPNFLLSVLLERAPQRPAPFPLPPISHSPAMVITQTTDSFYPPTPVSGTMLVNSSSTDYVSMFRPYVRRSVSYSCMLAAYRDPVQSEEMRESDVTKSMSARFQYRLIPTHTCSVAL